MIEIFRTFVTRLRKAFSFSAERLNSAPHLAAEQLEARILYSAAPVEAPGDAPAQQAEPAPPAAPAEAAASVAAAAPPAAEPAADAAAADAAPAEVGDGDLSSSQGVTLVAVDEATSTLNQQAVESLAAEAKQRWIDSGISAEQIAALDAVSYGIADVGGAHLGVANGFTITIDDDAGGTGVDNWFIDATPDADEEFGSLSVSAASGRYDLLSTLIHEQGHVLGLGDVYGERTDVMDGLLDGGTRRLPTAGQARDAVIGSMAGDHFLTANIARASTTSAGAESDGASLRSSLSADGRYVVFESDATNLVGDDTNGVRDIFVKDLQTGVVTRASTDSAGTEGTAASVKASISADGRYVAFQSDATDLVTGDTNVATDIFVKDLVSGALARVSTDSSESESNGSSEDASISANGRYVAFSSAADNLVAGDTNGLTDIFVKDLKNGVVTRVSTDAAGGQSDGGSFAASISADGRHVVFASEAANLVAGDANALTDIFIKNLKTGAVNLVSSAADGTQGNAAAESAAVSSNGQFVVFSSAAANLVAVDTNGKKDIFRKDLLTGGVALVSTHADGTESQDDSFLPTISADGRLVAFNSAAANLVDDDTNPVQDVFVRDLLNGTVIRANTDAAGNETSVGDSSRASFSADGRFVAFDSNDATLLVGGDTNAVDDVFVKGISLLTRTFTTSVEINAAGNLEIADIDGADSNDNLFVGLRNDRLEIRDTKNTVGTSIVGSTLLDSLGRGVSIDLSTFTGNIFVRAYGGNDTVTIGDLNGLPAGVVVEDGDGQDVTRQKGVVTLTGGFLVDYRSERIVLEKGSAIHTDTGNIILYANFLNTGVGTFTGLSGDGGMVTSNAGKIDLRGNGGDTGNKNRGVYLKNTGISTGGDVFIVGEGGGTGSANGGVQLTTGTDIEAGGLLEIYGTGSALGKSSNYGALIQNATLTTTGAGQLFVQGEGEGSGSKNYGLSFKGATIAATGSGIVDIRGFGSTTAAGPANRGILSSSTSISSDVGAISVAASGGTGKNSNSGLRATGSTINSAQGDITVSGFAQGGTTGNSNRGIYLSGVGISSLLGGAIDITGQGGGGLNSNTALNLISSSLSAGSDVTIAGFSVPTTTGSGNRGGDIRKTQIVGATVGISAEGGTGKSNNSGLLISGGSVESKIGMITLNGAANSTASGSNNFGVQVSKALLTGGNGIDIDATGGGGISKNYGVYISSPTVDSGSGNLDIDGSALASTTGADNRGVRISKTGISAFSVDINGTGGGGSNGNEGLNITGGSIDSISTVDLDGRAKASTTGSKNSGAYLSRLMVDVSADFILLGNGGGGTSFNYGAFVSRSTLTSGNFVDFTATASDQTTGLSNTGLQLIGTTIDGGSTNILATGGTGTNSNRGMYMKGGSLQGGTSVVAIIANARDTTSGSRNVGAEFIGTTLDASTELLITGTGGGGTSNNSGLKFSKATLTSQSTKVDLAGSGVIGSSGSMNHGIELASATIHGGDNVTITGTGGGGVDSNQGVRIVGGLIDSNTGGTIINGGSLPGTSGSSNVGVFIFNRVMLNSPELDIDGIGGGVGGAGGLNHGIFMDRKITVVDANPEIDGIKGEGIDSLDLAGDFFP